MVLENNVFLIACATQGNIWRPQSTEPSHPFDFSATGVLRETTLMILTFLLAPDRAVARRATCQFCESRPSPLSHPIVLTRFIHGVHKSSTYRVVAICTNLRRLRRRPSFSTGFLDLVRIRGQKAVSGIDPDRVLHSTMKKAMAKFVRTNFRVDQSLFFCRTTPSSATAEAGALAARWSERRRRKQPGDSRSSSLQRMVRRCEYWERAVHQGDGTRGRPARRAWPRRLPSDLLQCSGRFASRAGG